MTPLGPPLASGPSQSSSGAAGSGSPSVGQEGFEAVKSPEEKRWKGGMGSQVPGICFMSGPLSLFPFCGILWMDEILLGTT